VDKFTANCGLLTVLRNTFSAKCSLLRPLFLLLFVGFVGSNAAVGADVQNAPIASAGPGPSFAIADFDGDLRPDLASVQTGPSNYSQTNYWIQLKLTAVGRQSVQLVGPSGGLQIAARDVNGDRAVDLVLTTAWFGQPVAIFLNDGHGSFSRVEPSAFPGASGESKTNWDCGSYEASDRTVLPSQSRARIWSDSRGLLDSQLEAGLIPHSISGLLLSRFPASHRGRAPPSESSRL
jgi:hypothetical protein